ncbi:hypothetical protein RHMOL_Rhmol03G0109300 [Rhododendron molle]|uniref:Uncharacterized protein n=1 Tax=Rhododendron molle TaxID=49168 RepID=A0ACC0PCI8_RHOML|nr:hypothetical protein RHMOL_Rhmol03G0109300 [Rhododendron molle]
MSNPKCMEAGKSLPLISSNNHGGGGVLKPKEKKKKKLIEEILGFPKELNSPPNIGRRRRRKKGKRIVLRSSAAADALSGISPRMAWKLKGWKFRIFSADVEFIQMPTSMMRLVSDYMVSERNSSQEFNFA